MEDLLTPVEGGRPFLESTRGRIVARLRRGAATVEELAGAVGLTDNGVRVHLATLERDGWISVGGVRRGEGPGKPATLYALDPEAAATLSSAYRPLLLALLGALGAHESPARLDALMREVGRRLGRELGASESGVSRERIVQLLESLGAAVEVSEGRKGRYQVTGFGCPVGMAVAVEPKVCRAVTALLASALGAEVTEHCERGSAAPCCRFEVRARP